MRRHPCRNLIGHAFIYVAIIHAALFGGNTALLATSAEEGSCASEGQCSSNAERLLLDSEPYECNDEHESCEFWASAGECDANSPYMHSNCARSCNQCGDVLIHQNSWGEGQIFDKSAQDVIDVLVKTEQYMLKQVHVEKRFKKVRRECQNREPRCAEWASVGECDKNPSYMLTKCAPSCQTCDQIDFDVRCPFNRDAPKVFRPNDLDAMFKRITTDEHYKKFEPIIHSRPKTSDEEGNDDGILNGPWVVTLENFLSEEECDTLIRLGGEEGYKQSVDVGKKLFDGTYDEFKNPGRTSTNAWCTEKCYDHSTTKQVVSKIENVTGIPDANSEYLQLLRYEVGQKYHTHHDYIDGENEERPQGVRLITVFLYLNDVEAGGGTNFPHLDITVMPKKGKALIWPSVHNHNPDLKDIRTEHQALPVEAGVKFGANAWLHARDFKSPYKRNCI